MKRHSQNGVALIITLIMLAVVTLMAITFLAISRRERTSVQVTVDQTDAKLMADAGLARAEAEAIARMIVSSNPLNYDLMVSTNYINPLGFLPGVSSSNNVNYDQRVGGGPLNTQDRIRNIADLFYSPRPPVYVDTNGNGALDFRFYLDLNRNGKFESTGWTNALNYLGYWITTNGVPVTNYFVGDPQWVGVLEHPDQMHSGFNRFIGRYAYIALPEGKSLDLNFIHNQAKQLGPTVDGYSRNQGVGSWELNLAAFLRDLNTNVWPNYFYTPSPLASSGGVPFQDAALLVRHRYVGDYHNLASVNQLQLAGALGLGAANAFLNGHIDIYARGPVMTGAYQPSQVPAIYQLPWSGSDNPQSYYDVQQLFSLGNNAIPSLVNPLTLLTRRLQTVAAVGRSSYDRYTFYRLLAQMGVDSTPSLAGRMNLNFTNDASGNMTNLVPWTPIGFFTNAANRLLQSSLTTNIVPLTPTRFFTNYTIGDTLVRSNINVTDIMLFPTNEYSSSVHRLLQLAANLYDATTNRVTVSGYPYLPSVFRPVFRRTATNNLPVVSIAGFVEETNSLFLNDARLDVAQLAARPVGVYSNVLLYGQPLVIGAKKGFPNLNEWNVQTALRVTRKLEVVRPSTNSLPTLTNQLYLLAITNLAGVEAWNSYSTNFPRQLVLHVEDRSTLRVANQFGLPLLFTNVGTIATMVIPPTGPNSWKPLQFKVPVSTNFVILTNEVYEPNGFLSGQYQPLWEPLNRGVPLWGLAVTNRLIYYLLDVSAPAAPRVVDYASFSSVQQETNVMQRVLLGLRNSPMALFWQIGTNGSLLPGITNQIAAATGRLPLPDAIWTSANLNPYQGFDKQKAMAFFEYFVYGVTTGSNRVYDVEARKQNFGLIAQAPFNPSPTLYYVERGQANDPLVHYMLADMPPGSSTNVWPADPVPFFELGSSNRHFNAYSPWGRPYAVFPNINVRPTDPAFKDPLVRSSDDWNFPGGKFPNIGWIGRVHRGTPWQTVYLKSPVPDLKTWTGWAGSAGTNPTNDWRLLEQFTVAPNANAARGLLSVNQTNLAAWSAALSGVNVLGTSPLSSYIQPNSPQLYQIVNGINRTRAAFPQQTFQHMGDVLATPELSVNSPFLSQVPATNRDDIAYERIPQQILSLLKPDEPRLVIYSFGQSLQPADRSLVMDPGPFFRLCTNYQITAEVVTRTVLRIEGGVKNPRAVVESYSILPTD